jgi:RHS repeat-associated protein
LYSGEQFDSKIGQQYLRQRYYDPATGRFNRLDPFFGNLNDPQSLHKYLYTHADPVNGIDPSGLESLGSLMSSIAIVGRVGSFSVRIINILDKIERVCDTFEQIQLLLRIFNGDLQAVFQKGLNLIKDQAIKDSSLNNVISLDGIRNALLTFQINIPRIMTELACNAFNGRLLNTIASLSKGKDSRLLIFMPTPSIKGVPNPIFLTNTGLKIKVSRGIYAKVALYFGYDSFRGRFFGVGSIPGLSKNEIKYPYQLFRMDYHDLHNGQHKNDAAYWEDNDYHFHILSKRKK